MTNDSVPVNIRSSLEAQDFWVKNIRNPNITESFRIRENNKTLQKIVPSDDNVKFVFSSREIKSFQLPYQKQQQPFEKDKNYLNKENVKINLKIPQNGHNPSPIRVRSSRSIERELFQRELELSELCFQDHKRKIRELSQKHQNVLKVNKALAKHQQEFYVL